jgi:hypothetical protein
MKSNDTDRMLRLIEGSLTEDAERELRDRIAASPELRREFERLNGTRQILRDTVRSSSERALRPFFTERLMSRLASRQSVEEELAGFLSRIFRPIAVAASLLLVGLAIYNATLSSQYEVRGNAAESVLALPPVSSASVYDLDLQSSTESRQ